MAENICPICNRLNDADAERCWYCQGDLTQNQQTRPVNGTDWLNGFRDESNQSPEFETPEPDHEFEPPEEVPDWLARIRTREQMEREAQANKEEVKEQENPITEKKEELPDWLKEIKAGYSGKKTVAEKEKPVQESISPFTPAADVESKPLSTGNDQTDDTAEWLSRLAAWKPVEEEVQTSIDDLRQNESVIPEINQEEFPVEKLPEAQFDLDSVAALHQAEYRPYELKREEGWQKLEAEDSKLETQSTPQEDQQLSFEDLKPDEEVLPASNFDINALKETISAKQSTPNYFGDKDPFDESLDNEDLEDFVLPAASDPAAPSVDSLIFSDKQIDSGVEDSHTTPFIPDDLPDWLASAKLESNSVKAKDDDVKEFETELEKADLPFWLESARTPVSKPSSSELIRSSDTNEEGLFAGIADALQTPNFNVDIRKPVGYGTALKVSDRQKLSANIFAGMVDETFDDGFDNIPQKTINLRVFWRLLMAIAFIGVIFLSKSILLPFVIQPELFPPEVITFYDQINAIPVDKPVLLAGDFEAAVAGELSWSSQSLLENLMRRNLRLVILASNPTGSTLMNQFVENSAKKVEGYDITNRVSNLGYLPGGYTGVQLLAANPRTAMPFTNDLDAAWNSEILHNINELSDFGALIVLSDKSESTRAWVEQVKPVLETTPLMFVVSAQAAPLLQPYYQNGQISGYVAGFYGSLAYQQLFQQTSDVDVHLSGFQSAMLLAFVIILVSGLITLIRPSSSERKG